MRVPSTCIGTDHLAFKGMRWRLLSQPSRTKISIVCVAIRQSGGLPHVRTARQKQTLQRKQLQQQQQQQYRQEIQNFSEQRNGTILFELVDKSPSYRVSQAHEQHRAQFNFMLQQCIEVCSSWQQLAQLVMELQQEGGGWDMINYISVSRLCGRLGALTGPVEQGVETGQQALTRNPALQEQYAWLRGELASKVEEHVSWFHSQHFAQVTTGLAAAGHANACFWAGMEANSERRLLSFAGNHLAQLMVALATPGHVPSLNWLQRSEIQVSKHWRAMSPGALTGILWAWGRFNHTPSRSVVEIMKQRLRGLMRRQQLGCQQLLQAIYGMARLTRHHPREAWLHSWCEEFQPYMGQVSPHVLVDVLFCLASLQFRPRDMWLSAALSQVRRGLNGWPGRTSNNHSSSAQSASSNWSNGSAVGVAEEWGNSAACMDAGDGVAHQEAGGGVAGAEGEAGGAKGSDRSASGAADHAAVERFTASGVSAAFPSQQAACKAAANDAHSSDDSVLVGCILRQPGQSYQSLQDMLKGSQGEEDEREDLPGAEEEGELSQSEQEGKCEEPSQEGEQEEGESFLESEEQGSFLERDWQSDAERLSEERESDLVEEESFLEGEEEFEEELFLLGEEDSQEQQGSVLSHTPEPGRVYSKRQGQLASTSAGPSGDYLASEDSGGLSEFEQQQQQGHEGAEGSQEGGPWDEGLATSAHNPEFWKLGQGMQHSGGPEQQDAEAYVALQQPMNVPQYTLLVPALAVCCPLVGQRVFMQQQQQLLHAGLDASHLAQLAWSLIATSFWPQQSWMDSYSLHAHALLPSMDALALADSLHSLSILGIRPSSAFLSAATERMLQLAEASTSLDDLPDPEALVSTLVALARCNHTPSPAWLHTMVSISGEQLQLLNGRCLADLLAALAAWQHRPPLEWLHSFESCALPLLPSCPPQQLSKLCWGLAILQHRPPTPWLHELLVHMRAGMKALSDSDFACVAWSFARLRHRPGTLWLEAYCEEALRRLPQLPSQEVVDITWALAAFAHPPTPVWMEMLEVLIVARWHTFRSKHMAVLLWAFQQFRYLPRNPAVLSAASAAMDSAHPSALQVSEPAACSVSYGSSSSV